MIYKSYIRCYFGDHMAKKTSNVLTILKSSLLIIGIGVALVIVSMLLQLVSILSADSSLIGNPDFIDAETPGRVSFVVMAYSIVSIPLFFLLYFWSGIRSVKKYQLDAVAAGGVSGLSYISAGIIQLILGTVLNAVLLTRGSGMPFSSAEGMIATTLFGEMSGVTGVGVSAVCGFGMLFLGAMVMFVVGGTGALFAQRK